MVDMVDSQLRRYLEDPSLLRLSEAEVESPLPHATVMVESDAEYDAIIRALYERGIVEPEEEETTVRHLGEPVYVGMFGVHKKWHTIDGKEEHVLRLILNLVPTNALQRPIGRAASELGFPGLWPQIVLFDDEVMLG